MLSERCNKENIDRLIRKRFGLTGLPPDKVITNLSDYSLSQTEKFVLSHGLDFCVPNTNVSSEVVFSKIESLLSQLDRLSPSSERVWVGCLHCKQSLSKRAHISQVVTRGAER